MEGIVLIIIGCIVLATSVLKLIAWLLHSIGRLFKGRLGSAFIVTVFVLVAMYFTGNLNV